LTTVSALYECADMLLQALVELICATLTRVRCAFNASRSHISRRHIKTLLCARLRAMQTTSACRGRGLREVNQLAVTTAV
jgi:hypothetical protein